MMGRPSHFCFTQSSWGRSRKVLHCPTGDNGGKGGGKTPLISLMEAQTLVLGTAAEVITESAAEGEAVAGAKGFSIR